ncbi:MAG: L-glutamate gamma-semialdehyde dehydrogenase [Rhodothermales bacterium]
MTNSRASIPSPVNEPVRSYAPGSPERDRIQLHLAEMKAQGPVEIMPVIGGEDVPTSEQQDVVAPHEHAHVLGHVHNGSSAEAQQAIDAALAARTDWGRMDWQDRAAIFLKAADLLAGPWRDTLNGATMLGQSKNIYQAEIDAACELIDFLRFNVKFMEFIYEQQPISSPGVWNRTQYRPLEGFVFAVTPFNFTAIQANLPIAPAMMGNTVVFKPSHTATFSAYYTLKLLEEAGLPAGVINMVPGDGPPIGNVAMAHPDLAGLHFTGSTGTFKHLWKQAGQNIDVYKSYPRIVGETGGKDFVVAHPSADAQAVATALVRGAFEYQGQKCSAASRAYLPASLWPTIRTAMKEQLEEIKVGTVEDFSNFINAVIDARSFEKITSYIDAAKQADGVTLIHGGTYDDSEGYFIEPTVLQVDDPSYRTMCEEIFGPVLTIYVYDDARFDEILPIVDSTSPYALTGSIFAQDRRVIAEVMQTLEQSAGNFYINDKPTGAVVGQQPFGGARASGTNDKAGAYMNLLRWTSPRSIKETFVPPHHFGYPFLG